MTIDDRDSDMDTDRVDGKCTSSLVVADSEGVDVATQRASMGGSGHTLVELFAATRSFLRKPHRNLPFLCTLAHWHTGNSSTVVVRTSHYSFDSSK